MNELTKLGMEKQGYRFVGEHSACKICAWTRKSLIDENFCYKEKFYNIKSHMCCQMSPSLVCCNSCLYCWREMSKETIGVKLKKVDEPKEIIEGCINAQRKLLTGFLGNEKVNFKKIREAQNPKYWAISLIGEPTIYPKLNELINELHKRKNCSFLVTNGMFPERLRKLEKLPTQLYISLDAPTEEIYKNIDRPMLKDCWDRLNKTLELLKSLDTRKVLRLTLVKGINMRNEEDYAKLINKSNADYIELKAYMFVGSSRERLSIENMPRHDEIKEFADKICKLTGLKNIDEKEDSRVVLLAEKDFRDRKLRFAD